MKIATKTVIKVEKKRDKNIYNASAELIHDEGTEHPYKLDIHFASFKEKRDLDRFIAKIVQAFDKLP